jgi:outer membrane protein X
LIIGTGDSWTNVGIGAKFFYNVTDPIRLAGEFDLFFPKYETTCWDISAYGHYLFPVADQVVVYPSVGLGIFGAKLKGFDGNSDFVFSLGGGADYALTPTLSLTGELRIKICDGHTRLNFVAGVAYKF